MSIADWLALGNFGLTAFVAYGVFRLNSKFDTLKGRVDEQGENQRAHVNAAGLHAQR